MNHFFKAILFLFPFFLNGVDIAITIDDYPTKASFLFNPKKRTQAFIRACENHQAKVAFFCIGSNFVKNSGKDLCPLLDQKGHFLCNHSMSHNHLSSQDIDTFKKEVLQLDHLLSPYSNRKKWYRYPYLDYGNKPQKGGSKEKMLASLKVLKELDYKEGYVTINTFDWYIDKKLSEAIKEKRFVNYKKLKKVYMRMLKAWCKFYINFYKKKIPQKITHTLLLHDNELNALFLDDILKMIKRSGWKIVSPEKAFTDTKWREQIIDNPNIFETPPPFWSAKEIDQLLKKEKVFIPFD